jgi:hypothetical protein
VLEEARPLFSVQGRIVLCLLGAAGLAQIVRWLARRRLGLGYGLIWTALFASLLLVAAFPQLVHGLARVLGSREPEGALRLGGFTFVIAVLLYLSLKTSRLQQRLNHLVQEIAVREGLPRDVRVDAPPHDPVAVPADVDGKP